LINAGRLQTALMRMSRACDREQVRPVNRGDGVEPDYAARTREFGMSAFMQSLGVFKARARFGTVVAGFPPGSSQMKNRIGRVLLIGLCASWLAACGSSGSSDSPPDTPDSGLSAGNGTCINRNSAVGIEGGGIRRVLGEISSIGGDGTLVVDCVRVSAGDAEIIINGI